VPEPDTEDWTTEIDSKYRLLAAKRCKQLQRGARPRVNNLTKKNTQVALEEVRLGLVQYQPNVKLPK
jgi:DNA-directed RNA polymerase omega subunit